MNPITSSLGVLSSMITPAILILASGSLVMTTSQRLSRAVERVRRISQEFMQIEKNPDATSAVEVKRRILYSLLKKSARRCKLLTHAMTFLYLSLGLFVATSLAIGVVGVIDLRYAWIPTGLGVMGAILLFISSTILIIESRLTFSVIADEVDFVIESSRSQAPEQSVESRSKWRRWFHL